MHPGNKDKDGDPRMLSENLKATLDVNAQETSKRTHGI